MCINLYTLFSFTYTPKYTNSTTTVAGFKDAALFFSPNIAAGATPSAAAATIVPSQQHDQTITNHDGTSHGKGSE